MAVGIMLFAPQLLLGFLRKRVQKLGVQQTPRGFLATPFIISLVQPPRQHHMGRADISIIAVPFDQRDLVQRRRTFRVFVEKRPRARSALHPKIAEFLVLGDRIIAAVKPIGDLERVLPLVIGKSINRSLGIHIQQHCTERPDRRCIQPIRQRPDRPCVAERINQKFIDIDHQRPMPVPITRLQPVQPIHPEPRPFIALPGFPQRHVRLIHQVFRRPVIRAIVHHQEMINPKLAVVFQEIFQPHLFVAQRGKHQNIVGLDLLSAIRHGLQITTLTERANTPPFALQPKPV